MGSHDKLPRQAPTENTGAWLRFGDRDVEIPEGETIAGRSQRCGVILDDPLVSRTHARIVSNRGVITIEDLKSENGILINGEPVLRADGYRPEWMNPWTRAATRSSLFRLTRKLGVGTLAPEA